MRSLLFLCLCAASFAAAASGTGRKPLEVATVVAQQQQIRDEVLAGKGRYRGMPAHVRVELLSKQAGLLTLLEGKRTSAELTQNQQMEAFNTLEWTEGAINGAEGERVTCRREKIVGSNRAIRVCRTAAEEQRARERAREDMERHQSGL